jgi:hypothetical protein
MKKYLVLYESPTPAREMMANSTPEQMQAGMDAWGVWAGQAGSAILDLGAPVADGQKVGGGSAESSVTGFSILQANSQDEAVKLLEGHPHFQTPGGASIEVYEFLDVPGM